MANRLSGKVAVVSGSTAGIGRGSAELFSEEGDRLVVNGRRCKADDARQLWSTGGCATIPLRRIITKQR